MKNIVHKNEGPTSIMIEITPSRIENYVEMFGKRKTIKVCELNKIVRVVKDITTFENKTKLTIYYSENGKEKRFGGIGFSIEGNLSDESFLNVIDYLKTHLSTSVLWEDKASKKASGVTKEGALEFPIAGYLHLLFYKHPSHSGERKMIIFLKLILATLVALIPITLILALLLSKDINITALLITLVIAVPFAYYSFKIFSINFTKGGLHTLFVEDGKIRINQGVNTTDVKLKNIQSLTYKVIELTIRQMNTQSTSSSMEYEFLINGNIKFVMGENSALPFIEKVRELNILTENKY